MEVAIYADPSPKAMLSEKFGGIHDRVADLGRVDALHVNVHSSKGVWRYTEQQWADLVAMYYNFRCRPVAWPNPATWSTEDKHRLMRMVEVAHAIPVFDLEHQWLKADPVEDVLLDRDFPFARITTHLNHPIVTQKRLIARQSGGLEVQALSVDSRGGKGVRWGSDLAPGPMQAEAIRRGTEARGAHRDAPIGPKAHPVFITLPAYKQANFLPSKAKAGIIPPKPKGTMTVALNACLHPQVLGVSYWSLKHILKNDYAYEFIRDTLPAMLKDRPLAW